MSGDPQPAERYFYRSARVSHRDSMVSIYLVERCHGSPVVARIEAMGLVHSRIGDHEIALRGLRRNLVSVGPWRATRSARHTRVAVRPLR
ncbi:MAG: hypothetical protein ABR963_07095 [Acidimicrobiales bacterium]|jgi:hypothetical protein